MANKIISDIKKYLIEENIYTSKDELTLKLLENTYSNYLIAVKEVKLNGQVIVTLDYNKNKKYVTNPSFKNQMELQKELFKLIDSLYLTPKSRKTKKEDVDKEKNPFEDLMNRIVEKR